MIARYDIEEISSLWKEENEKRKVEIASIDAKEKAAKAELKSTKAREKAEKAREKAEKARDKANKAVNKHREVR
jgi:endonuclease YncB( thermonuclease family)